VFSNASDVKSLRNLLISYNKLTSLEPWWYYRCIQGSISSLVNVVLSHNMISTFTNKLQFNFQCGIMKRPFGYLHLDNNRIVHLMDFVHGWNLTESYITKFWCLRNVIHRYPRMKFYLGENNYACDCIDFPIF